MKAKFIGLLCLIFFLMYSNDAAKCNTPSADNFEFSKDTTTQAKTKNILLFFYVLTGCGISFTLILTFYLQSRKNKLLLEKEIESERIILKYLNSIAQQLKTPLALITGPLEVLEEKVNSEDKHLLLITNRNAHHLHQMVTQLQRISQMNTDEMKMNFDKCDVVSMLKGLIAYYEQQINEKELIVKLNTKYEHYNILADNNKLEMVFMNLFTNAIKYSFKKGLIELEISEDRSKNNLVTIKIRDRGQGIQADLLPHIFNRFYHIKHSGGLPEGNEIGLFFTKEIILKHFGTINVSSKECEGTTFSIALPVHRHHLKTMSPESQSFRHTNLITGNKEVHTLQEKNQQAHNTDKPVVLLISDNNDLRQYLRSILRKYFLIIEANSHKSAFNKTLDYRPELIINDHSHSLNDEISFYYTLRNSLKTSTTPIIALTTDKSALAANGKLSSLLNSIVEKPFKAIQLTNEVLKHISIEERFKTAHNDSKGIFSTNENYTSADQKFMTNIYKVIETNYKNELFGVEKLSAEIGISRSKLQRKVKEITKQTPNQLVRNYRLNKAHEHILNRTANISEIAYQVGFSSPSYFTRCFTKRYGYAPNETLSRTPAP